MCRGPNTADRINSFAVVSYIPDPLAEFLDRLRQELVPNCFLRAHITILPPRPSTSTSTEQDWELLRQAASLFQPFEIELKGVEVFPISDVIYVSVARGEEQMRPMHAAMNIGGLEFQERYDYHPHVTLAQDLKPDEFDELIRVARRRWVESSLSRAFLVDKLTFVQSSRRKTWIDLAECSLGINGDPGNPQLRQQDEPLVLT